MDTFSLDAFWQKGYITNELIQNNQKAWKVKIKSLTKQFYFITFFEKIIYLSR